MDYGQTNTLHPCVQKQKHHLVRPNSDRRKISRYVNESPKIGGFPKREVRDETKDRRKREGTQKRRESQCYMKPEGTKP